MSFSTNLDDYSYSADPDPCAICFDPDKTPEKMFLCFANIQIGALWIPADPPPPYGTFELTHAGFCEWLLVDADYRFRYQSDGIRTVAQVFTLPFDNIFIGDPSPPCENWFGNQLINPAIQKYYGGYCIAISPLPGGIPNITDIMELMSDSPDWSQWLQPIPTATDTGSYRLSNRQDKTNVRILMDIP